MMFWLKPARSGKKIIGDKAASSELINILWNAYREAAIVTTGLANLDRDLLVGIAPRP